VVLNAETPHHRVKAVWEPAGVKAREQAGVQAGVREKAEVADKAAIGSLNKSTIQLINDTYRR
jgi:hypothetical protein